MASTPTALAEGLPSESTLLPRLLALYDEERRIYCRVLDLSRRQGEIMRQGADLHEIRRILEQKKGCLAIVARLEKLEHANKSAWEQRRHAFSADGRSRLRAALRQVGDLIEQILACEEANDNELIEQSRAV